MITCKCLDFEKMEFPVGMLVQRSDHFQKDRCISGTPQIGVITEFEIYTNDDEYPVVWPTIAWEGVGTGPSTTNPALVDVHRSEDKKAAIYIDIVV